MEQQPTDPTTTPAGVAVAAGALLARLGEVLWAAKTSDELVDVVVALEQVRCQVAALQAPALAEIDARGAARTELAWGSTAEWFTHLAGLHRAEGHRTVRQAAALLTDYATTHAALSRGAISPEQAAVIVTAVDRLPLDPAVRAEGEAALLTEAGRLNATDLTRAGQHLAAVVDPERAERKLEQALDREDRAAHHHRYLAITEDGAGGIRLRGRGTVEDAAVIKAALLPLTKPEPARAALGADGDEDSGCLEAKDPRDHGARLWDALVDTCRHALTTDLPPDCHGATPQITVTVSLDTLRGQIDWATLGADGSHPGSTTVGGVTDEGLQLTPAVVRRLACDADLIPIALGTKGEVLDVGRAHRLVTPALWRALVCRDRHCAFPGCTRPPVMGHAHHITPWADGGHTSLTNLVLLCGHHHRVLHHTPWQVRIRRSDGRPEFLPPPRPDHPPDQWIRSRPRRE
ncbi:DUF222 domain-containing protein [Nocardioides sp. MAHUQ-72]|uniref:HNH endonuclease signature motif containing protein n=1 Tax=unclassified Nocardioides TaxID=2615069 RepID=UPI00361EA55A